MVRRIEYGRVEHTRSGKWRVFGYKSTGGETTLGEFDTRGEAADRLQEYVAAERASGVKRRDKRPIW